MRRPLLLLSLALAFPACNCGKPQGLLETSGILVVSPEAVEFGPVTEFSQALKSLSLENAGRGALTMSLALEANTSPEFSLGPAPVELAAGAKVDVQLTFAPLGAGEDVGAIIITSDEPDRAPVHVPLHGGAIHPSLAFEPDPLAFAPVAASLVTKQALLHNVGGATLHVSAIGVNAAGNPDFSILPPVLPLLLVPDASVPVSVTYARSLNAAEGLLEVVSDDPADGGVRGLRLIPDPAHVCGDGLDNDGDGLIDFPDDPGCTSADDSDEYNPPECVTGGVQPCGSSTGICRQGVRTCANSIWGACDGGVRAAPETCNGLDDDCNGMSDENISELCSINGCAGARACVPNSGVDAGLFTACIPISSMPEQCNGLDDNCNGQVDEGVVQACAVFGCVGVRVCVPGSDGGFTSCMPGNPLPETCNGVDDNCNGQVDDLPDIACGIGPCRRLAAACVNGGAGTCVPGVGSAEICNGVDDDCDGIIDNGIPLLSCGVGACANTALACLLDGGMNVCVPGMSSAETCNNIDDNCNGLRDEQTDGGPLRQGCYSGDAGTRNVGRCVDGTQSCTTGAWGGCGGEVLPTTETCNNIDDNCNGAIDESLARACYSGTVLTRSVGRCHDGVQTCTAGSWGATCPGEVLPNATEICGNSIDDNCNGATDEGCGSCNPNGVFTLDAGLISYACCDFGFGPTVSINISQFQISSSGTVLTPASTQPGTTLTTDGGVANAATCPAGSFTFTRVLAGSCTETYKLTGSFVGTNTFVGTYSATYSGAQCATSLCAGDPCVSQTWPISAGR